MEKTLFTTGLPGLDEVFQGVMPGDNIVWEVENIDDYRALVVPYVDAALAAGQHLVYFRFAGHPALIEERDGIEVCPFDPAVGFEQFVTQIHDVIERVGRGGVYVFDCLSDLADAWQSDQALGNFFVLTCPRLYDLETVTYFAYIRNRHAAYAIRPITSTTQFLLDIFRYKKGLYIRPIKTQHRSAAAMNTMHEWRGDAFLPITDSATLAEILASSKWPGMRADRHIGYWRRVFSAAELTLHDYAAGQGSRETMDAMFQSLSRMVLTCDDRMAALVDQYLALEDLLAICDRMIGIGKIGGKAVGMLLARAILKRSDPRWESLLETHDSFYIGSDVFYTFLVRNKIWWLRQKQRHPDSFLDDLEVAREKIMQGSFPDYTSEQFVQMLDYLGESPYIVRSSSLLEDNYGNAFAGKYDSVFCVNQGSREERLAELLNAIRRVYASTMSETALRYRHQRGLLDQDEQMALLVMRVSGAAHGKAFYPHVAGVGFSYNPYVWHKEIDPSSGVVRLVFGLGTRAVDRVDDDYTRVVALNAPDKRPEGNFDEICEYSQRRVDYLDLKANRLTNSYFVDLVSDAEDLPVDMFAAPSPAGEASGDSRLSVLTFDTLLSETPFVSDMKDMLSSLEKAYDYPVDIEFTLNVRPGGSYCINLLQCRPLQVQGTGQITLPALEAGESQRIVEARGAVIGMSRIVDVDRIIYIVPARYAGLSMAQRFEVARLIGQVNAACDPAAVNMLIGPGRWGTRSPELGVPVHFAEINRIGVLCEIVAMRENLVPDVSLGTHFLNELVEMNILYLALFPRASGNHIRESLIMELPNKLTDLAPAAAPWNEVVRVADGADLPEPARALRLYANACDQKVCVYLDTH
jgi:pyruvate, water dikinase